MTWSDLDTEPALSSLADFHLFVCVAVEVKLLQVCSINFVALHIRSPVFGGCKKKKTPNHYLQVFVYSLIHLVHKPYCSHRTRKALALPHCKKKKKNGGRYLSSLVIRIFSQCLVLYAKTPFCTSSPQLFVPMPRTVMGHVFISMWCGPRGGTFVGILFFSWVGSMYELYPWQATSGTAVVELDCFRYIGDKQRAQNLV
jgi:hypothetical protein